MNARLREEMEIPARTPPASVEAEQSVLGAIMRDPKAMAKVALQPEDFFLRTHQVLFKAMLDLDAEAKPLDALTVGVYLEEAGLDMAVGGSGYVAELANNAYSSAQVGHHAGIVRDRSRMRRVIEVASVLLQEAFTPHGKTSAQLVDSAVGELMALAKLESNCDFSLRQAVRLAWADAEVAYEHRGQIRGVPSGFARMDARLGGFHKQDLVFLGGRPGMAKTALMVNWGLHAASCSHTVGMISGEQSAMQIGQRSLAVDAVVKAESMRNGNIPDDVWPKLTESMQRLANRRVRIFDRSAPTLEEVVRVARRWKQEYGMSILFVDYLQRIRFRGAQSRHEEVGEVAQGLKTLARDLDIPVVCLAQVKADVETRSDKRPHQGDIANSDEATREADLIAFLYRDEVYHDKTPDRGIAEINVEKNRHGPCGQFKVKFNAESMLFTDLEPKAEHEEQPPAPRRAREVPISGASEPVRGSRRSKAEVRAAAEAEAADSRIRDVTGDR